MIPMMMMMMMMMMTSALTRGGCQGEIRVYLRLKEARAALARRSNTAP